MYAWCSERGHHHHRLSVIEPVGGVNLTPIVQERRRPAMLALAVI